MSLKNNFLNAFFFTVSRRPSRSTVYRMSMSSRLLIYGRRRTLPRSLAPSSLSVVRYVSHHTRTLREKFPSRLRRFDERSQLEKNANFEPIFLSRPTGTLSSRDPTSDPSLLTKPRGNSAKSSSRLARPSSVSRLERTRVRPRQARTSELAAKSSLENEHPSFSLYPYPVPSPRFLS